MTASRGLLVFCHHERSLAIITSPLFVILLAHYGCFDPSGMVAPASDLACFSSSSTVMPVMPVRLAPRKLAPLRLACNRLASLKSASLRLAPLRSAPLRSTPHKTALVSSAPISLAPLRL